MLKSLPVYQTITWYDSVSSFSEIEKKTGLTTLKNNLDDLMEILQFGDSPSLDLHRHIYVEAAIKFVCLFYDSKSI